MTHRGAGSASSARPSPLPEARRGRICGRRAAQPCPRAARHPAAVETGSDRRVLRHRAGLDRGQMRGPIPSFDPRRPIARPFRFAGISQWAGADLRAFAASAACPDGGSTPRANVSSRSATRAAGSPARIVYSGREMTGLADVEAAPMLGPDGRPITARGWYDSESIALDGSLVYVGLERVNQVLRFDSARASRARAARWCRCRRRRRSCRTTRGSKRL